MMERYLKRKTPSTFDNSPPSRGVHLNGALAYRSSSNTLEKCILRGNVSKMMKVIQNENGIDIDIANDLAQKVLESIIKEIGDDVFSLLVDESSDVSGKKQLIVVLRYVDAFGIVKERFVGLVDVTETSASSLKTGIESLVSSYGLSLKKVRGQGYCGASDMRDDFKGLKDLIRKENGSAYHMHCFAHQFQLVVMAVAKKHIGVGNFFDMIVVLINVVSTSCKQKDTVRESHKEKMQEAISSRGKMEYGLDKELFRMQDGDTRWASQYKTLMHLFFYFPSVLEVLEYIEEEGDNDLSQRQANSLHIYFKSFDFLFYFHLMFHILGLTHVSSRAFLLKGLTNENATSLVKTTKQVLQNYRADGFDSLLKKISSFCEKHDIEMFNLKEDYVDPKKQRQKTNITYRHYYEFNCFNIVVDMLIQEYGDQFSEESSELLMCMSALDPSKSFRDFDTSKLFKLTGFYPDDFTCEERTTLKHHLDIYIDKVQKDERFASLNGIVDLARVMVETRTHISHPLVYRLLKLALVLPVVPATVERSFYAIKLMKSSLLNRIGDDFLNACLICAVEKEALASLTNEDIMNRLQKM